MSQSSATPASDGLIASWTTFWFAPRQTLGLHLIRLIFGILLLFMMLPFAGYLNDFFGYEGWFDRAAFTEAGSEHIDNQSWSLLYLVAQDKTLLTVFYWASVAIIALFTLGFFTRITSVLTWLIVVSFTANPLIEVDTDVFFRIMSFYLMIGYLLLDVGRDDLPTFTKLLSPMNHWLGTMLKADAMSPGSSAATVSIRLIQVHFALAMIIMGLHKLQMAEWWAGVSFWYPLHRPSETSLEAINELRTRANQYLNWMSFASYLVLAWQIFFPTFAWRPGRFRWILLGGALTGAIGLMLIYPIPLLGPTFFLFCLCYLNDFEWLTLISPLRRLVKS